MEQIQFIYFQYYMQYYTVHHKENSTYMEIWHRGWWFKLRPQRPVCFGFTMVLTPYHEHEPRGHGFFRVWPQHELLLGLEVGPRGPAPGEGAVASLQSEEDEATASGLHIPVDYCAAVVHQLGVGKWLGMQTFGYWRLL